MTRRCKTPGHEDRQAYGHGLCRSCWARQRAETDPAFRAKRQALGRARVARRRAERARQDAEAAAIGALMRRGATADEAVFALLAARLRQEPK